MQNFFRSFYSVIFLALILSGCGEISQLPTGKSPSEQLIKDAEALLVEARNTGSPDREYYQIRAAQLFVQAEKNDRAEEVLATINPGLLNTSDYLEYTLLYCEVAMANDEYFTVRNLSEAERLSDLWPNMPADQKIRILHYRADVQALLGDEPAAIKSYIALSDLQEFPADRISTHSALWSILSRLPHQQLAESDNQNETLTGWLELALQFRNNQGNIRQQLANFKDWQNTHPAHPASLYPPAAISSLQNLGNNLPQRIAILLPTHGNLMQAGKAIEEGFLAAWFDNQSQYGDAPQVTFYDSSQNQPIELLYQQAVTEGAELVIGPLQKSAVEQLNRNAVLTIPTIALNYLDTTETEADPPEPINTTTASPEQDEAELALETTVETPSTASPQTNLIQMGLLVEDEARQIAQRAWREGKRHALVIVPQTQWAEKASNAFIALWEQMGGTVELLPPYNANQRDFAPLLEPPLHIDQSLSRNQRLERLLGKDLAYTPRRRQDVDMVFLVAYPDHARQIKPTLNFLFAADLDVYATSHIYNGTMQYGRDRDLNDIRFSAMPWTLDGYLPDALKPDDRVPVAYRQLYALGMDAYLIHQWITQLQQNPESMLAGATGTLHLGAGYRIQRELPWAIFRNGAVTSATSLGK